LSRDLAHVTAPWHFGHHVVVIDDVWLFWVAMAI
jgi:hypothetical protein